MKPVNIHDLRKGFSRHLRRVAAGEEIVIARHRVPVARLEPIWRGEPRNIGMDAGKFSVPVDFNSLAAEDYPPSRTIAERSDPSGGAT